jgi:hypothetical protein
MLLVGITFVAGLIYFIPALLATACHHPRLMRVWGLNLLGFTVIGWVLALRETIYGVHNVYGKHSPEGSLLTQRFTLNRYFVLAVIGIGLVAVSITLGLHQLRPAPGAPVVTPVAAGDCPSSQVLVRMNGASACLNPMTDRVRVRFDDEPHSLSWDEANSPIYADRWKTASRVSITVDVATPAASSVAAQ